MSAINSRVSFFYAGVDSIIEHLASKMPFLEGFERHLYLYPYRYDTTVDDEKTGEKVERSDPIAFSSLPVLTMPPKVFSDLVKFCEGHEINIHLQKEYAATQETSSVAIVDCDYQKMLLSESPEDSKADAHSALKAHFGFLHAKHPSLAKDILMQLVLLNYGGYFLDVPIQMHEPLTVQSAPYGILYRQESENSIHLDAIAGRQGHPTLKAILKHNMKALELILTDVPAEFTQKNIASALDWLNKQEDLNHRVLCGTTNAFNSLFAAYAPYPYYWQYIIFTHGFYLQGLEKVVLQIANLFNGSQSCFRLQDTLKTHGLISDQIWMHPGTFQMRIKSMTSPTGLVSTQHSEQAKISAPNKSEPEQISDYFHLLLTHFINLTFCRKGMHNSTPLEISIESLRGEAEMLSGGAAGGGGGGGNPPSRKATTFLERAMQLGHSPDDAKWLDKSITVD